MLRENDATGNPQESRRTPRNRSQFELAADILNTAVTPTWTDIEKLAAIATLRTALNYFLERELQQEAKPFNSVRRPLPRGLMPR